MFCKSMKNFFIGADVSKKTLDCVLYDTDNEKMRASHIKIYNSKEGLNELIKWMKGLGIVKSQAVVCMEYTGKYSFDFAELLERKKIDFVLVPALKIKGAFACARGKNDRVDAGRIASYAYRYRDELVPTNLKDDKIVRLRELMNDRKLAVKHAAAYKTIMKEYKEKKSSPRYKRAEKIVTEYKKQIAAIEKEIIQMINSDEKMKNNYDLLTSIPGISFVNSINLIVFTGNFTFFNDSRKFASYAGVAPFEYSSGTSVNRGTHVSKMANKMLKSDLSQAAKAAISFDPWLKEYYERKRADGKSFGCVLNAVKFKLICRAFAVIKRNTPYVNTMKYTA